MNKPLSQMFRRLHSHERDTSTERRPPDKSRGVNQQLKSPQSVPNTSVGPLARSFDLNDLDSMCSVAVAERQGWTALCQPAGSMGVGHLGVCPSLACGPAFDCPAQQLVRPCPLISGRCHFVVEHQA